MKLLFTNPLAKTGATIALAMAGLLSVGAAHAVGTAAGTDINNISLLSYSVGGTPQNQICSSGAGGGNSASTALTTGSTCGGVGGAGGTFTAFKVDNKVNLLVATTNTTFVSVVPGLTGVTGLNLNSASQVTTFTVTNLGNSVQDFSLTPGNPTGSPTLFGGTDNFDGTSCVARVESGGTLGYDSADTATFIDELSAVATAGANVRTVYVICAIPAAQVNNDVAVVSLTATALIGGTAGQGAALTQTTTADTAGVDIVFADGIGTETADLARDATFSARSAFRVVSATLSVTKVVVPVCDPFNGSVDPKNIPGTFVRYTITVANTAAAGGASATLGTVSDTLVNLVTFDPNLITGAGAPATTTSCTSGGAVEVGGAAGRGFKIVQTTRGITGSFLTNDSGDTDGASITGQTVTINYAQALPAVAGVGGYAAGELKAGESVVVYFNAIIN